PADPYIVLGIEPWRPFADIRKRYRQLVAEDHPDRLIRRGLPQEFIKIATAPLAAINAAHEAIERDLAPARVDLRPTMLAPKCGFPPISASGGAWMLPT